MSVWRRRRLRELLSATPPSPTLADPADAAAVRAAVTYLAAQVLIAAVILAIVVPRRLRRRLRA